MEGYSVYIGTSSTLYCRKASIIIIYLINSQVKLLCGSLLPPTVFPRGFSAGAHTGLVCPDRHRGSARTRPVRRQHRRRGSQRKPALPEILERFVTYSPHMRFFLASFLRTALRPTPLGEHRPPILRRRCRAPVLHCPENTKKSRQQTMEAVEYARSTAVCIAQSCAVEYVYGRKACLCRGYFGTG